MLNINELRKQILFEDIKDADLGKLFSRNWKKKMLFWLHRYLRSSHWSCAKT